jgi:hypothetical protein
VLCHLSMGNVTDTLHLAYVCVSRKAPGAI